MKELSIEEKAKRYDEILARATGANLPYYTEDIMSKVKEFVDYLLPELKKESEDERIRKALIYHYQGDGCLCTNEYRIDYKDIRTYLEKRGEQMPAWSEEDEKMCTATIFALAGFMGNEDKLDWLKSLKERCNWKPSDEQMRVLDLAIRCGINRGTTEETTLVSLFNNLKKLREE